jgi:hypothetical protein
MKNPFGKTADVEKPYAVFKLGTAWEWRVLKTYQKPENEAKNQYARWFVAAKSPYTYGSWEYGDLYINDVAGNLVESTDEWVEAYKLKITDEDEALLAELFA